MTRFPLRPTLRDVAISATRECATALIAWLCLLSCGFAGDWPQVLGPHRNAIAAEDERLADAWPEEGPPVIWERPVGSGYAGVSVVGEIVILFHRERGEEVVEALSASTGETLWRDGHPTTFYPQVGGGDGPLCVPAVQAGKVITYGAQGILRCNELKTGKREWLRDTHRDFGAREGYFGAGSSPVVVGDRVIVNVGGSRQNAGVVAFSLTDGETLWKKTEEPASYSAPTSVLVEGRPHVLMLTRYKCLLIDAEEGAIRFQFPFGQRGPTVNAATPLVSDETLLVTAAYGIGTVYATYSIYNVESVWESERLLASQYCTPIRIGSHLYAIDGRDDVPPADLKCIDLDAERVLWVEQNYGYGSLLFADGKLLSCGTNGELVLGRASPEGFVRLASHRISRGTVRALPALSEGRLFVRDEQLLKCLDVGSKGEVDAR